MIIKKKRSKEDKRLSKASLEDLEKDLKIEGVLYLGEVIEQFFVLLNGINASNIHTNEKIFSSRKKIEGLLKYAKTTYENDPNVDKYTRTYLGILDSFTLRPEFLSEECHFTKRNMHCDPYQQKYTEPIKPMIN